MGQKELLKEAIEKAIGDDNIRYIIVDDWIDLERYDEILLGNNYLIRAFGDYYVAFIFQE